MAWWDRFDLVLGDRPLQILLAALIKINQQREKQQLPPPTIIEILQAYATALGIFFKQYDSDKNIYRIRISTEKHGYLSSPAIPLAVDNLMTVILLQAFNEINIAYQEQIGCDAKDAEIVETLMYLIRPQPDKYFSNAKGLELLDIELISDKKSSMQS